MASEQITSLHLIASNKDCQNVGQVLRLIDLQSGFSLIHDIPPKLPGKSGGALDLDWTD